MKTREGERPRSAQQRWNVRPALTQKKGKMEGFPITRGGQINKNGKERTRRNSF